MKKLILLFIIITMFLGLNGWVTESATLEEFFYGQTLNTEYDNWLSHVVEGIAAADYNLYAPYDRQTTGFGSFTAPTGTHLNAWTNITNALTSGDYALADTLLMESGMPFQLVEFIDTENGQTYWMIRENLNMIYYDDNGTPDWDGDDESGSFDYGWGVFVINPEALYPVVITAPHVADDFFTAPVAVQLFRDSGAYGLLMNGVGREVAWNDPDPPYAYSNSYSLCDPSRVEDLPFNRVYQSFCNHAREFYGMRELSVQIHGYDWNRHLWYANCQISAGYGRNNPGLPIRDYSAYGYDIINASEPWIFSANEIGVHEAIHLNDFFAVHCGVYDFYYHNDEVTFPVNTSIDLPGYSYNRQMIYSCSGWNDTMTFDPFFHIEMDELPNCYPQTLASYYWFFGYDPMRQRFEYERIFDNVLAFYAPWVEALSEVIPHVFNYDDGDIPPSVEPLEIVSQNYHGVKLSWAQTNCFDYDTYQILYGTQPIANGVYNIWSRTNDAQLNNSARTYTFISGLSANTEYFFQARVLDANGNISELSNEESCYTAPARLQNEKAVGRDGYVNFSFLAVTQNGNNGFMIYRQAENEEEYSLIDSWETNPLLAALNGINNYTYNWSDSTVTNWTEYKYLAASTDSLGNEYWHNYPVSVTPFDIYTLHFADSSQEITDEIWFGASPNATSGFDADYDLDQDETPSGNYVFAEFYEADWQYHSTMIRQIEAGCDFDEELRTWVFRVKTNQYNNIITLQASGDFLRDGRKLYITDQTSGQTVDLLNNDYTFSNPDVNWRNFSLYWGNIVPAVDFAGGGNQIYQAGESVSFSWNISNSYLVESINAYIVTSTDEIQIASNLPAFFNQVNWSVPESLLLEDAQVIVDLLMIDGDRRQYTSSARFGTVPSSYTLAVPAGKYLVSNPFTDINEPEQLLGADAVIYTLESGAYQEETEFLYGRGYLLESAFGNVSLIASDIQSNSAQFELEMGWNIVPNPHLTGYLRDDLRIISPNLEMTFAEAVQFDLIESVIYTISDTWRETGYIRPNESFLLYVKEQGLQVKFIPYVQNYNWLPLAENDYRVRLTASQSSGRDELVLVLNAAASDEYDRYYDLPEPPSQTGESNISFYGLLEGGGIFTRFNQNAAGLYDVLNEQKDWSFGLEMQQVEEIFFSLESMNLPEEIVVIMTLDGEEYDLSREGDFYYQPTAEIIEGMISFVPEWMAGENESIIPALSLVNYPNPYKEGMQRSSEILIAFNLPEAGEARLSVYNLKGQKVADLAKGEYTAGAHLLTWNLKNSQSRAVASGIYFTRLSYAGQEKFSKLVIIR